MNSYWRKIFGWSKTRQTLWDTCKLAYYYHYIGKWEGFPGDPQRERLQKLSKLKKFVFWKGELIHEIIRNQIALFSRHRPFLEDGAKKYFEQQIEDVKNYPQSIVTEAANGLIVDDERFEAVRSDGLLQLDHFFQMVWPRYENRSVLECERLNSFRVNETRVWAQVDLVTRGEDEGIVITDWKTGDEKWVEIEGDEQMGVYVLWAMDYFKASLKEVSAEFVFLRSGESKSIPKTNNQLDRLKESILERAGEMFDVQSEEDFPADPAERKCVECNFATICPEGRRFISLSRNIG